MTLTYNRPTYEFFSHKKSKSKKKTKKKHVFFFFWGGGAGGGHGRGEGGRGWVDGWTEEQSETNLPLHFLRCWGHNNALMYKLCP